MVLSRRQKGKADKLIEEINQWKRDVMGVQFLPLKLRGATCRMKTVIPKSNETDYSTKSTSQGDISVTPRDPFHTYDLQNRMTFIACHFNILRL